MFDILCCICVNNINNIMSENSDDMVYWYIILYHSNTIILYTKNSTYWIKNMRTMNKELSNQKSPSLQSVLSVKLFLT